MKPVRKKLLWGLLLFLTLLSAATLALLTNLEPPRVTLSFIDYSREHEYPMASLTISNAGPVTVRYLGYSPDSPFYTSSQETPAGWSSPDSPLWCGTGVSWHKLHPGEVQTIQVPVPEPDLPHRWKVGFTCTPPHWTDHLPKVLRPSLAKYFPPAPDLTSWSDPLPFQPTPEDIQNEWKRKLASAPPNLSLVPPLRTQNPIPAPEPARSPSEH